LPQRIATLEMLSRKRRAGWLRSAKKRWLSIAALSTVDCRRATSPFMPLAMFGSLKIRSNSSATMSSVTASCGRTSRAAPLSRAMRTTLAWVPGVAGAGAACSVLSELNSVWLPAPLPGLPVDSSSLVRALTRRSRVVATLAVSAATSWASTGVVSR
jgi:hypothetical protein